MNKQNLHFPSLQLQAKLIIINVLTIHYEVSLCSPKVCFFTFSFAWWSPWPFQIDYHALNDRRETFIWINYRLIRRNLSRFIAHPSFKLSSLAAIIYSVFTIFLILHPFPFFSFPVIQWISCYHNLIYIFLSLSFQTTEPEFGCWYTRNGVTFNRP